MAVNIVGVTYPPHPNPGQSTRLYAEALKTLGRIAIQKSFSGNFRLPCDTHIPPWESPKPVKKRKILACYDLNGQTFLLKRHEDNQHSTTSFYITLDLMNTFAGVIATDGDAVLLSELHVTYEIIAIIPGMGDGGDGEEGTHTITRTGNFLSAGFAPQKNVLDIFERRCRKKTLIKSLSK